MVYSALLGAVSLSLLLFTESTHAVKHGDFKTCSQAGFCRRGRALSARAKESSNWNSPYSVDASSISSDAATLRAAVKSSLYPDIKFSLDLQVHTDGVVRVRMDEVDGIRKRYDGAASWALIAEPQLSSTHKWWVGKKDARLSYDKVDVVVNFSPLKVTVLRGGKEQVVLNGQGLLHMEHFRNKSEPVPEVVSEEVSEGGGEAQKVVEVPNPRAWFEGDSEDALWDETFSSWTDSKPKGPESLSLDINFPNHGYIYGIPQHATRLNLPTTTGENATFSDPYRLYNADVFEYIASSPMSLYGSIPILHAHSAESTVGIFDAVASETWIDVAHGAKSSTQTHWISESGIMDIFIMPGPSPEDVFCQYATLTGTPVLPAHWALGYHQCRWNYINSDDIRTVQKRFDEEDMPVDVFWLDIEYSQDHKYFMWDPKLFPDPVDMINEVAENARKMVVIVDPHLKRTNDYPAYKKAAELEVLVKPKSGEGEYEGWCWSGSSSWVDFFNPKSWEYWKGLFRNNHVAGEWTWTESTNDVHIWNDMNEPSVFNGPEITMPKDNIHYGGWEHRDIHNVNGMLFANMTSQAILARSDPPQRPFVLTRSFFAGSQRHGAMWTGDNMGTWEHMEVGVKMVLSNAIAGMSFGGADVGGFFGNPEPEMLVRWYAVGAFAPFFRAHAHIDTKRREPFLLEEPYKGMVKDMLKLRYSMLPVWYTAFRETSVTGLPVLRPQYVAFPKHEAGFDIDDQYYIGSSGLLVKPVTAKDVVETTIYLAENQIYYDYFTHALYRGTDNGFTYTVPAELGQVPLFIRGGSIIPTRERPRRSSSLMKKDPFTLRVALENNGGSARGELYLDDGESYSHQEGKIIWREFVSEKKGKQIKISSKDLAAKNAATAVDGVALATIDPQNEFAKSMEEVRVEKILMVGLGAKPKSVKVEGGKEVAWEYVAGKGAMKGKPSIPGVLVVKDPGVSITKDWVIVVQL